MCSAIQGKIIRSSRFGYLRHSFNFGPTTLCNDVQVCFLIETHCTKCKYQIIRSYNVIKTKSDDAPVFSFCAAGC
jgi:hypothetical protein